MFKHLVAVAAITIMSVPLGAQSWASEADAVVGGVQKPSATQPVTPGSAGYNEQVAAQLDNIESIPRINMGTGGPRTGSGSSKVEFKTSLPTEISSIWPAPEAKLMFPLRESRVSFKEPVDSRTFQGRIVDAKTNEVATGVDGSPALFTRATITASEALDVVGTYPTLGPGKYMLDFTVKTVAGKAVKGSVPFTQLEPIISPGGGNHRHGDVRLPFEEQFTTLARGLIIMAFGLLFRRKAKGILIPAALGLAGAIHLTAVAIPASDTILTTAELLGRIDGWAAAGVLVAALAAAMARKTSERVVAVFFAAAASLATTYIPNMSTAVPVSLLLVSTMAAVGLWVANAFGWRKNGSAIWLLVGAYAAFAPAAASWVASTSLRSDRVLEAGLRGNLLTAAIILATSTISVILVRLLPANKLVSLLVRGLALIVVVCAAIATAAPALL